MFTPEEKANIETGRKAVDTHRAAHIVLHSKPWHKGIPEEHTPLLNKLIDQLKLQGFNSIPQLFDASELLNIHELGFVDKVDFSANATNANRIALEKMWN